jgi:hypothetical protein
MRALSSRKASRRGFGRLMPLSGPDDPPIAGAQRASRARNVPRHLPSDFVRVDDLGDERAREAVSLVGMGRANPRFDRTAP